MIGRKNYYGSGAEWSAQLNADTLSITQTLALWGINPQLWFMEYFETCAKSGGKAPSSIAPFLPWNLYMKKLKEYGVEPNRIPKAKPDFKMENQEDVHASEVVKKNSVVISSPTASLGGKLREKSLTSVLHATIPPALAARRNERATFSQGFSSVKAENRLLPHRNRNFEPTASLIDST